MDRPNSNSLQQMCHLREFFIVHHMREKEDKSSAIVPLPTFRPQECVLDLRDNPNGEYEHLSKTYEKSSWQDFEKVICERIGGQEIMFLTKTCQSVFSPVSSNSLKPQAVVGEQFSLWIPVENKFQTTLLLKNVHLLWKFSSNDQTDLVVNDGTKKSANADKFVVSEELESVTVNGSSKVHIRLPLTVLQTGELYIVGIEYGLKAQFPQSESTDYTIRGKQYFEIKGPRLRATKEQKTSVVYGKDNRLSLEVKEPQARLKAKIDLPNTLFQGQLKSLELSLTNVGKAPMTNVYLISKNPGLFSVSKKKSTNTIFDFPIVTDPSLVQMKENGDNVEVPLDFLPISLPGKILPGKSIKVSLWLRGPDKIGMNDIELFYYYENCLPTSKKSYRIQQQNFFLKILPSVTMSASKSALCVHKNDPSQMVILHLSNISKESARSLEPIYVSQIGLISHSFALDSFQWKSKECSVAKANSGAISLQMIKMDNRVKSSNKKLHFSSVGLNKLQNISEPPYIDFLKNGFNCENVKESPKLKEDLLVVFWKGSGSDPIIGQSVIPIHQMKLHPKNRDVVDGNDGDLEITCATPSTILPCNINIDMKPEFHHDFTKCKVFSAPCTLTATNMSEVNAKFILKVEENSDFLKLVGCIEATVCLKPKETKTFKFHLVVTRPGLFQSRALHFQLVEAERQSDQSVQFIPVAICFVIKQSQGDK